MATCLLSFVFFLSKVTNQFLQYIWKMYCRKSCLKSCFYTIFSIVFFFNTVKYLPTCMTKKSLVLCLLYIFLLISKTIIISSLILSPLGNTNLFKTEKHLYVEREVNITPIPVLYKKNFTKLPVWDFEDVYLRDRNARKPVSASFLTPVLRHIALF